ncbi:MAG: F0F1 ATP synthase subunit epsilon [Armatimonadota bacterium]
MPERKFTVEIITPDKVVLKNDEIISLVVPGSQGYMGVLSHHAPLITELDIGEIDYTTFDGTQDCIAISNGFLEIYENKVTVLAESAELACDIDVERAEKALHRAEDRIRLHTDDIDIDRAELAMKRAINRLHVVQKYRSLH